MNTTYSKEEIERLNKIMNICDQQIQKLQMDKLKIQGVVEYLTAMLAKEEEVTDAES